MRLKILPTLLPRGVSLLLLAVAQVATAGEAFQLSAIFQNHMVLQRDRPICVWGKGTPGASVTVAFAGQTATCAAIGADGLWEARFPKTFAVCAEGRSLTASCSDGSEVALADVVVGDVWIAAGQSNMVMPLTGSSYGNTYGGSEAKAALKATAQVRFRLLSGNRPSDETTPYTVPGSAWGAGANGNAINAWSAVASHFALDLVRAHPDVPIGILQSVKNSQPLSPWMPDDGGFWTNHFAPICRFAVRGGIWYQGEGNSSTATTYDQLLEAMVLAWRDRFGLKDDEFPFYFVQLSGYDNYDNEWLDPSGDTGHVFRDIRDSMQRAALKIPNVGMAVNFDCGRAFDPNRGWDRGMFVHSCCKNVAGSRLAYHALKDVYGDDIAADSPYVAATTVGGDGTIAAHLNLADTESLTVAYKSSFDDGFPTNTPGAPVRGFAIAGINRVWSYADAAVSGDTVTLSAADCPRPVYVRYAYRSNPIDGQATLYGTRDGVFLPVVPFHSDAPADCALRTRDIRDWAAYPGPVYAGDDPATTVFTNVPSKLSGLTFRNAVFVDNSKEITIQGSNVLDNAEIVGTSTRRFFLQGALGLRHDASFHQYGVETWQSASHAAGMILSVEDGVSKVSYLTWSNLKAGVAGLLSVSNAELRLVNDLTVKNSCGQPRLVLANGSDRAARLLAEGKMTFAAKVPIELTIPAEGLAAAPLAAKEEVAFESNVCFRIDATAVTRSLIVPLATSETALTCDLAGLEDAAEIALGDGMAAYLDSDGQTLSLVILDGATPVHRHVWGEWVVTTPPEIGKAGVETRTCKSEGCGMTETREIPALPDPGSYTPDTKEATYTWKAEVQSGDWCDPANWTTDMGTFGYPSNTLVKARIPSVGGYVIDLKGSAIPLKNATGALSFDAPAADGATGPVTLRNGVIKTGLVAPAGDVTLDGVAFTDNYCQPAVDCQLTFTGTSPVENKELAVTAAGVDCEILGDTRCGRGQLGTKNGATTLTVSNATLSFSATLNIYATPVIRLLQGGRIACEKNATTGKFQPNSGAKPRIELALVAADQAAPRITASYTASLQGSTAFVIASLDAPGRYPLVRAEDGITGTDGCTLDVSALGDGWSGSLEYADKTLWAVIEGGAAPEVIPPTFADGDGKRAFELTAAGRVKLHLTNVNGALYYALATATTLQDGGDWKTNEFRKGQTDFDVERDPSAPAGFYKVIVREAP